MVSQCDRCEPNSEGTLCAGDHQPDRLARGWDDDTEGGGGVSTGADGREDDVCGEEYGKGVLCWVLNVRALMDYNRSIAICINATISDIHRYPT